MQERKRLDEGMTIKPVGKSPGDRLRTYYTNHQDFNLVALFEGLCSIQKEYHAYHHTAAPLLLHSFLHCYHIG